LAYSKISETKIISFFEVNKNEKLESMVISKLHSDMIYTCPNCNKDLTILIKSNPQDSNHAFQISLAIVEQIEKPMMKIEENNQISEDTIEFIDICTQKSNAEDELHELSLNHDIVNENTTNDNEQDINKMHENSPKDTNPYITLQETDISGELNKDIKRKIQNNCPIKTFVNSTKKLKIKLDVIEQNTSELNNDYDRSSIIDLITFQSVNNDMECLSQESKKEEKCNTEYTTEKKCLDKNLIKSKTFETKKVAREQNESSTDYDRLNVTDLITFQSENDNMKCLNGNMEINDANIIDITKTVEECNEDNTNVINIPKNNLKVCNLCGACYISQLKYEFHMRRHKLNETDKYICTICNIETKNENLLWDHYLLMHKSPTQYICLDCNRSFTKKPNLNEHQKKYRHSAYKTVLNIKTDVDNNQKVITKQKRKCTICRKLMKDIDPKDAVNDLAICASCEDSACLIVDGEAKVISQRQYHCLKCRKHFMRQERLEFHEMRHNENMDEFICSTCGKDFSGENSLYEHYLFVHKGARPHVCEVCGKSFQLKARLKEHHRKHTGEKPYQCEICGHRCMTSHSLKFHKKSHFSTRHTCEICGKSFIKKQNLNEHLEKHWKKDKNVSLPRIFKCPVCNCDLPTFRMLKHHMIGIHKLDRQDPLIMKQKPLYECNECQEKFKHQMSLKAHKEKVHEGKIMPRIFQCDICKVIFKVKQMLINHIKSKHSGEKRYKCVQCNMRFADIKTLYNHVLLHTDKKPFTCEYCSMNFRRRDMRDIHRRKHTNNRPYQCTDCNDSFDSYTSRSNHRKKVHGDKETECPECGLKCSDMQEIRIHLNKHLGEKLNKLEST